jgi:protoheme IX farnesyltransferase
MAAYVALTKPRIIELLLITTVPAMFAAQRGVPSVGIMFATLFGGMLAAGSANALNCVYDADIDEIMRRTRNRPLAKHTVSQRHALIFAVAIGVASVAFLAVTTTWQAGALTAAAILFYVLVYTMLLKRRTSQNIVWGGLAGCMPVIIGWSAVTGGIGWPAWVFFGVIFFWTPPHTWALAMRYREDYAAVDVPMLPVLRSGEAVARQIVAYSWVMVAVSLALWPIADTGVVYPIAAVVLGATFLVEAHLMWARARTSDDLSVIKPMRLFHWSNLYLSLLFVAVALDPLLTR